MKIETKYNFGDKVYQIWNTRCKQWEKCSFCGGDGRIIGKDSKSVLCPECYGNKGRNIFIEEKYTIQKQLTIGQVKIKATGKYTTEDRDNFFDNYGDQEESYKESYMCYETGIGSGTVWPVDKLFPTEEEAQTECDRLNK
jgi:hypothetical protein